MFKTHDVIELMSYGIFECDGRVSDEPDENGNYEMYKTNVKSDGNVMYADFTTECNGKSFTDKYKFTVEYIG